jgi:hypothetical protein
MLSVWTTNRYIVPEPGRLSLAYSLATRRKAFSYNHPNNTIAANSSPFLTWDWVLNGPSFPLNQVSTSKKTPNKRQVKLPAKTDKKTQPPFSHTEPWATLAISSFGYNRRIDGMPDVITSGNRTNWPHGRRSVFLCGKHQATWQDCAAVRSVHTIMIIPIRFGR